MHRPQRFSSAALFSLEAHFPVQIERRDSRFLDGAVWRYVAHQKGRDPYASATRSV
jgi:hypothetical protein